MKKKGYTAAVLLLFCLALQARERRYILNSDVMEYMPRRSHRYNRYSTAEMFQLDSIRTIDFRSIAMRLDGTLGWASTVADGWGTRPVTIGKIYIHGLFLPQGNSWEGRVYPANHIVILRNRTYPAFRLHPVRPEKK